MLKNIELAELSQRFIICIIKGFLCFIQSYSKSVVYGAGGDFVPKETSDNV